MKILLLLFLFLQSPVLFAQQIAPEKQDHHAEKRTPIEKEDQRFYQKALAAKQKGEFEKALLLLRQAYEEDKNAFFLFERALVLEQMGERDLALRVLDENMEVLKNHPEVTNLALTRERIANMESSTIENPHAEKSTGNTFIGPLFIGSGAAATLAGIVLIIISNANASDARCHLNVKKPGCDNPTTRAAPTDIQADLDSANLLNITGFGVGAAGLLLTGVGFTLTF